MPSDNDAVQSDDMQNQKEVIKHYFVNKSEDRFTDTKAATCSFSFMANEYYPKASELNSGQFEPLKTLFSEYGSKESFASAKLNMSLSFGSGGFGDQISFLFIFRGNNGRYSHSLSFPGLENITLYLILNNTKKITLSETDGHSLSHEGFDKTEISFLKIPMSEYIEIASAEKVEYRISTGAFNIDGIFDSDQMSLLRGFYNNLFDEDFFAEELYKFYLKTKPLRDVQERRQELVQKAQTSEGCYIATAVYGDYDHPSVLRLRKFRDEFLKLHALGRAFIRCYYFLSPGLARQLRKSPSINSFVRRLLETLLSTFRR